MDDRQLLHRRLASAGILQDLLGYSACEAVHAAQDIDVATFSELTAAAGDPVRNRGILRAMAAMERPRPMRHPVPYPVFAEPS